MFTLRSEGWPGATHLKSRGWGGVPGGAQGTAHTEPHSWRKHGAFKLLKEGQAGAQELRVASYWMGWDGSGSTRGQHPGAEIVGLSPWLRKGGGSRMNGWMRSHRHGETDIHWVFSQWSLWNLGCEQYWADAWVTWRQAKKTLPVWGSLQRNWESHSHD